MTFPAGASITVGDVTVSNVELGANSLEALETIELGTASLSALAPLDTVELGSTTLAALENVTATLVETGTTPIDKSGTITVGGTAQQLAAAKADRSVFIIQNISAGELGYNIVGGTAAIGTAGTFTLASKEAHSWRGKECPVGAISIIGATTGQAFTAIEV